MPKPKSQTGQKNLIGNRLKMLRNKAVPKISQRDMARKLQLLGIDMDKNAITRIETNKRYVSDIELQAFAKIFDVTYDYLIDGKEMEQVNAP